MIHSSFTGWSMLVRVFWSIMPLLLSPLVMYPEWGASGPPDHIGSPSSTQYIALWMIGVSTVLPYFLYKITSPYSSNDVYPDVTPSVYEMIWVRWAFCMITTSPIPILGSMLPDSTATAGRGVPRPIWEISMSNPIITATNSRSFNRPIQRLSLFLNSLI